MKTNEKCLLNKPRCYVRIEIIHLYFNPKSYILSTSFEWNRVQLLSQINVRAQNFHFIYLLLYVMFNSQGHFATGSLQVEETNAYCTVNHRASASNYQLFKMKRPARNSNRRPQRLEARTAHRTTTRFCATRHVRMLCTLTVHKPKSIFCAQIMLDQLSIILSC